MYVARKMAGVPFPVAVTYCSLLHIAHTLGTESILYNGFREFLPGVKTAETWN
jgi:hypothetical protein